MNLGELFGALSAGWQQFAQEGMYIGLFFATLLFLWLVCYNKFSKCGYKGKRILFFYSLGITFLVLFPVSAFVLLKYQTAFFTYSQLFLTIPILPVIAWGMTEFFSWIREYLLTKKETPEVVKSKPWICEVAVVAVLAAVIWMAGSLSVTNEVTAKATNDVKIPDGVLQVLGVLQTDEAIDLDTDIVVATDEILEYARAYSGDIKLLYGRNMWQKELNAFTYDVYPEELEDVHDWLSVTVHGLFAVETEISVDRFFEILEDYECTVLVLTTRQYAEDEVKRVLSEGNFEVVAELPQYVIIKR